LWGWGEREGARVEMTQALYAHMNNNNIKKKYILLVSDNTFSGEEMAIIERKFSAGLFLGCSIDYKTL
jgi:hypothetical protein